MEALRKAEEAKRIAAQKPKENESAEGQSTLSTAPIAQNSLEDEDETENSDTQALDAAPLQEDSDDELLGDFSFATDDSSGTQSSESESTDLDIPFDFQIDESFGVDSESVEPEEAASLETEEPQESDNDAFWSAEILLELISLSIEDA